VSIRRADPAEPRRRRGVGPFLKRWTIPVVGAITPVGLIAVNISIFIAKHLAQFRWTIAILAFVSSLMLNSWAGLNIFRLFSQRRPGHALVQERNQELVLVGGMALIIVIAFLTALFCYQGLANENDLPNGLTFLTGVVAIVVPVLLQAVFRSRLRRRVTSAQSRPQPTTGYTPPVPPAPSPPPLQDHARRG
jgi:hypothetical protein